MRSGCRVHQARESSRPPAAETAPCPTRREPIKKLGAHVKSGERGTTVVFADRFICKGMELI